MFKTLIVFYSRSGVTKKVARYLSERLMADTEELESVMNRDGMIGYMLSGQEGMLAKETKIKETSKNPEDYDLVIIGTPVWSYNISSPIRTYINKNKFAFKNVAFFSTYGGNAGKTFVELEKLCGRSPASSLGLLTKDIVRNNFKEKTNEFIGKLNK